jgi:hypothetical protein
MASTEIDLFLMVLKQICLGSLISGLIIFFLTLFVQGSHLFDHDTDIDHDIDHDVSIDHGGMDLGHADVDLDTDVDLSVDIDTDVSIGIDKDIHLGVDKDIHLSADKHIDLHDHGIDADTPTPLMLLLGTFMITFGGIGTLIIDIALHPLIIIFIIFALPVITTFLVSKIWGRLAVSETYEMPLETIKIDDPVKTITTVDTEGGLVVIDTSSIHGPVKMSAKTRYGAIPKSMTAYVIEIQKNTLIIDEWPSTEDKEKPIPKQDSMKWG